jgi:SAM-dependent methyltransferase
MRVADIGCGVGAMTAWIAREVGPEGEVVAVDISAEQVRKAQETLAAEGLTNVRFVTAGAVDTGLPRASFDLVYTRFVLMHLPDPVQALRELRDLVRPGGVLACEDGDFTSPFCEPPSPAFDRCFELYRAIGERRGLDFRIGPKLHRMFLEAGFAAPMVTLAQPVFVRGEEKRLPEWTLQESAPALTEAGLAAAEEIADVAAQMEALAANPSVMFGMARMTQVHARIDPI